MEEPLISVIIPVYKVEQYLDRCLKSVVNQTYKNLEIILVDDGSPDNCPQLCDEWAEKDKRIFVKHQVNRGAGAARNAGLSIASGELIGFVDSDDWVDLRMYETLYKMLLQFPEAQMAMCGTVWTSQKQRDENHKVSLLTQEQMLRHFFREDGGQSDFGIYTKLIKKEILSDFKFKEGTISEDVIASYYFDTHCNKIALTSEKLYFYFDNNSGVTKSQVTKRDFEYIEAFNWIASDIKTVCPTLEELAINNYYRANFTILSKMKLFGYDKNNKELSKQFREMKLVVRRNFLTIMKMKMPISRKALLIYDCI